MIFFRQRFPRLLALLPLLTACSPPPASVRATLARACGPQPGCVVRLARLTPFRWDAVYVFRASASAPDLRQALGQPYPHYREFTEKLVFVRDSAIVHHEDTPIDVERVAAGAVVFAFPDSLRYARYTPGTAVFRLATARPGGEAYLTATPVR